MLLHQLADLTHGQEAEEVASQPAGGFFLHPARRTGRALPSALLHGCCEGEALQAGLLQPDSRVRLLARRPEYYFSLAVMAVLFLNFSFKISRFLMVACATHTRIAAVIFVSQGIFRQTIRK